MSAIESSVTQGTVATIDRDEFGACAECKAERWHKFGCSAGSGYVDKVSVRDILIALTGR